jgi:hypothetical protein
MSDTTQLTPEEIQQYREKLKDNAQASEDIDLIEQCDGDLEYAAIRLARRANIDTIRADEETFWQKAVMEARLLVCQDGLRDNLAPNILGGLIGLFLTSSSPVLGVVATPIAIYIVEESLEDFCNF